MEWRTPHSSIASQDVCSQVRGPCALTEQTGMFDDPDPDDALYDDMLAIHQPKKTVINIGGEVDMTNKPMPLSSEQLLHKVDGG